jgi:hypothetical protein
MSKMNARVLLSMNLLDRLCTVEAVGSAATYSNLAMKYFTPPVIIVSAGLKRSDGKI